MMEYPYNSSVVLTDSIFVKFGGQIGTSTSQQREMAYLLAEDQMTEHLSTFLIPTIITGSIALLGNGLFSTEYGHVRQVFSVSVESVRQLSPLQTEIHTGSALIRNAEHGYLEVFVGCSNFWMSKSYAAYESGFSTGTSNQPLMLSALTLAAQINLNEMDVSLANEGVADVGIQRFSNQSYSEERKFLGNTVFGNSATAQRIARLVRRYRSKPAILLR